MLRTFVDLPFIAALGVEVAMGRSSPQLMEVALIAMVLGAALGWMLAHAGWLLRRRFARW